MSSFIISNREISCSLSAGITRMVVKVYVSFISADKEVKQRQKTILQILDSKKIHHEVIDITVEDNKIHKEFMLNNATNLGKTSFESNPTHPLPPQIFNDSEYCGDYEHFEEANENKQLDKFLKLVPDEGETYTSTAEFRANETA